MLECQLVRPRRRPAVLRPETFVPKRAQMPTYQYRCSECGQDLEVVQKFSDASLTECPNCHGALRKVYNAVGVVFKGSGFYSTDNRSKGTKVGAGNGSDSSSSSSDSKSSSDAKADSSSGKSDSSSSSSGSSSSESSSSKAPAKAAAN
ncbi:putative regulatory protein, FmdB family [Microlunatus soli]|uniref:Putative regulatory protein, FmdB family n=2 Tax=Microlunatus soli TaxID=630515 RepID=A0A1H1RB97_9ACTN|nr:putative regulatory protein, FmdB family [Microlunatus soli]